MTGPVEQVLTWLDDTKPLWDFLTGVGTVGAVIVSLYLAQRKPKIKFNLEIILRREVAEYRVTNVGESDRVLKWVYLRLAFGLVELGGYVAINGRGNFALPKGMAVGDVFSMYASVEGTADSVAKCLPKGADAKDVDDGFRRAKFCCSTTTNETFSIPLKPELRDAIAERIKLHLKKI